MSTTTISVSQKEWESLKKLIEKVETQWMTEEETCNLLGISRRTLTNYLSSGRITRDMFRVGVGGNKYFNKEKIMGK